MTHIPAGTRVANSRHGHVHIASKVMRSGAVACLCGTSLMGVRQSGLDGPDCGTCQTLAGQK